MVFWQPYSVKGNTVVWIKLLMFSNKSNIKHFLFYMEKQKQK